MTANLLQILRTILGEKYVLTANSQTEEFLRESRGIYQSECLAVVLPQSTEQVSKVVELCAQLGVSIVPQGGNTGHVGGTTSNKNQLILNLKKLNKVLSWDTQNNSMIVEAGCILSDIQTAATSINRVYPVSLGSEGSCQIGGNIASNAGGTNVLHYGNTREQILGLEVVLANSKILNNLKALRKDNSGYDLNNIFIGSEGTLGIITKAILRLHPMVNSQDAAIAGFSNVADAMALLGRLREDCCNPITTFELMSDFCIQSAVQLIAGQQSPFKKPCKWNVLIVTSQTANTAQLDNNYSKGSLQSALSKYLDDGLIDQAIVAQNIGQTQKFKGLRSAIVAVQKYLGASIKHDVAVPISAIDRFIELAEKRIYELLPHAQPFVFGHIGDGNIHFNIAQNNPHSGEIEKQVFMSHYAQINRCVHDIVADLNGTVSAEHGVGISKLKEIYRYKDQVELDLLRNIKTMMDPQNILNPGKLVDLN